MSDREFSEEEVVAVLERAGPLQDEDLMALAQELGLDLTHPARRAHFRKTMQWSTIQFALDTLRQACEPRDHARDLLEYLAAHPDQLPALLRGELGASPRFQDNIAVPGIRRHLLTDGPPRDDPAFMVIWVDWMWARIRQIHSEIPRRRGKPKINAPLQVFIEHLARSPWHSAKRSHARLTPASPRRSHSFASSTKLSFLAAWRRKGLFNRSAAYPAPRALKPSKTWIG
jgi:hypothetical protein